MCRGSCFLLSSHWKCSGNLLIAYIISHHLSLNNGDLRRFLNFLKNYLQSTTARLDEWRVRRRDTEEWMRHRQLPEELQERVRRFVQYKWLTTRGVDEEAILRALPLDLRRQIQRHLCLALVRRVSHMEHHVLITSHSSNKP